MKPNVPENSEAINTQHGVLTKDNDLSKTQESLATIEGMVTALEAGSNDMAAHFDINFVWRGNFGCGTKFGLADFRNRWQIPFRNCFSDRVYIDEARLAQGEWVSSFGHIHARHTDTFMMIPPTDKKVIIRYTDFWHVRNRLIVNNWVTVDFPDILQQLGHDVFDGHGWDNMAKE